MSRTRLIALNVLILFVGLFFTAPAWGGDLKTPAGTVTTLSAPSSNPQGVLLVDLNGDGNMDLVVAEPAADQIEFFKGNGDGTFGAGTTLTTGANTQPVSIAAGVLRSAGTHPDLVVGLKQSGALAIFDNTSAGATITLTKQATNFNLAGGGNDPEGVAIADMNNDGKMDVVVADAGLDKVHVLLGDAATPVVLTAAGGSAFTVGTAPNAVVVADFNNDGKKDFATANKTGNSVSILTNTTTFPNTTLTFSSATSTTSTNTPTGITAGVTTTAGFPDIIVAENAGTNVGVLLNDGAGGFPASTTDVFSTGAPIGVALADFDADGNLDIVASNASGAMLLFNYGGGSFVGAKNKNVAAGTGPGAISVGDLNGDGRADVAIGNSNSKVSILINTPFFNITPLAVTNPVEGVSFGPTDLVTFEYDGTPAVGTFSANVNWGGGTNDTGITPTLNAGVYTVTGPSHLYPDPGAQGVKNVTITVTNTTVPTHVITAANTITVDDADLTALATPNISSNGAPVPFTFPATTLVANFADANTTAPASDFTANIDWGDCGGGGSPGACGFVAAGTVAGPTGGPFNVQGGHQYTALGNFTVKTQITDTEGGGTKTVTVTITANVGSVSVTGTAIAGSEGIALANVQTASFVSTRGGNAAGQFTATVDWGDCGAGGTPGVCAPVAATVNGGPNNYTVTGSHTYVEAGAFTVVTKVDDTVDTSSGTGSSTATIADGALSVVAVGAAINATEGSSTGVAVVGKFDDANPAAPISDFTTVTIHWQDAACTPQPACTTTTGTVTQPGGVGTTFFVTGSHTYPEGGTYNVTFDVVDVDSPNPGDPGRITGGAGVTINVADAPLTHNTTGAAITGVEGAPINGAPVTIATFNDGNALGTTADFTTAPGSVTIHWGDAGCAPQPACTTSTGTVTGPTGGPFTIKGTHTYPEPGVYTVTYDVIDQESPNPGDPGRIIGGPGPTATITDAPLTPVAVSNLSQVEGNVTFTNVTVGKFNDGNLTAPITDYTTVNIHWGDGNTTVGTVTQPGGVGTTFFITGSHTYASPEEATYNVTYDVFDVDSPNPGDPGRITGGTGPTITITDAPLTVAAVPGLSNVEGNGTFTNVIVGSFTDGYANAPLTDFAAGATIHWGDGNTTAATVTQPGGVGTPFVITGTHVYANTEESNVYNITFDVADVGGSTLTGAAGAQVTFTDAPLFVGPAPAPLATTEGLPLTNVAVGTFTDGYVNAPLGDFAAGTVIHWGDGNSTAGTVTQPGGVGTAFVVNGTHTYAEKGVFNITFDVADVGGSTLNGAAGTTATIADAPLTAGAPPANLNGVEGNPVTGAVGTFTDGNPIAPIADFPPANVTIHWGDGNTSTGTVTQPGGVGTAFLVTGTHTYAEPGVYNVTYDVFDIDSPNVGDPGRITGGVGNSVTVTDGALTVVATAGINAFEGNPVNQVVANFNDQNPAAPIGDFVTVNIHWGDGNTTAGVLASLGGGNFSITGAHTYPEKGVFNVTFDVVDVDSPNVGDPGRITGGAGATITVNDAPLGMGAAINTGGGQGVPVNGGTAFVIANFYDCNPAAPLADFNTPTIHWGDGGTSNGTIAANGTSANAACTGGTAANFTISAPAGTHTYASNGVFNITIDVADVDGSTINGGAAGQITVAPGVVVQTCTNLPNETACTPAFPGPGTFVLSSSNFVNNLVVFAFEDSNPGAGAFGNPVIDWGDGSVSAATSVDPLGQAACQVYPFNGATNCSHFTVSGNHVYQALGSYNATVSVGGTTLQVTLNVLSIAASLVNEQISPPSSQVKAGSSVDLLVTLSPTTPGGYNQSVTLSCSSDPLVAAPLPAGMACAFNPSATVPDVNQVRQVHVIVTTRANIATNAVPMLPGRNAPAQLALLLPAFFGTFGMLLLPSSRKGRKRAFLWFGAALLLFVVLLAGCGGGGTIGGGGGGGNGTPAGTYNVYVQANVPGLTAPVAVIQVVQ